MFDVKNITLPNGREITKYYYHLNSDDKKIGILFGHFAPFTGPNGHGRMLKILEQEGCEAFLIVIPKSKQTFDDKRNMFVWDQRMEIAQLGSAFCTELPVKMGFTSGFTPGTNAIIGKILPQIVEKYGTDVRPIFAVGPDRPELKGLCQPYSESNEAGKDTITLGNETFDKCEYIYIEDRGEGDVSGTQVRQLIKDDNLEEASKVTGYPLEFIEYLSELRKQNLGVEPMKESKRYREGGNMRVDGADGLKSATKLQPENMSEEVAEEFKTYFKDYLKTMNRLFKEKYGYPIWDSEATIDNNEMFSGSSRLFFEQPIEEFKKYKKTMGDMDIQMPEEYKLDIMDFLHDNVGKDINGTTIYGLSLTSLLNKDAPWEEQDRSKVPQAHTLTQMDKNFPGIGAEFIQIDWEFVEWAGEKPTEFSTFAHYSAWDDLQANVKGVFQKYIVQSLTSASSKMPLDLYMPKKDKSSNNKYNQTAMKALYSFSVDVGLRRKFNFLKDENGNQRMGQKYPDARAVRERPTSESRLSKNIPVIFKMCYGVFPTKAQIKKFYSFVGNLELLVDCLNNEDSKRDEEFVKSVYRSFIFKLWGKDENGKNSAQGLDAYDPNVDRDVKDKALEQFYKYLPFLKDEYEEDTNEQKEAYYRDYKVKEYED